MIEKTINYLIENKISIATAESCTGGLIAKTVTDFPGVSGIFAEGYVTYSNEAKMKNLGVKKDTLDAYGAVSEQTAREMAEGVRRVSGADVGVSSTGIAGPDGGTPAKPVGLVYIACSTEHGCTVRELHLSGCRDDVRKKTVTEVFTLISDSIK
ncbi:MAG: nicotinamide-nucleotide amidohydrolase family protein [Clostridia bacterium]|nr:nicotinamide-nucleotide amidohydrolase family protein [Clostridia bacterium]